MKAIEAHGPYKIHGEKRYYAPYGYFIGGVFRKQHRMKLPGGSAYPTLLRDHQLINYGTFC